jgi:hypothetical protein
VRAREDLAHRFIHGRAVGLERRRQAAERHRRELFERVAEHRGRGGVRLEDPLVRQVVRDQRLGRDLEAEPIARLADAQLALGGEARAAIGGLAHRALDRRHVATRLVLREKIERARAQRGDGRLLARRARDHDHGDREAARADVRERLLAAEPRQDPVADDDVPRLADRGRELAFRNDAMRVDLIARLAKLAQEHRVIVIGVFDCEETEVLRNYLHQQRSR